MRLCSAFFRPGVARMRRRRRKNAEYINFSGGKQSPAEAKTQLKPVRVDHACSQRYAKLGLLLTERPGSLHNYSKYYGKTAVFIHW
jgi:hypothetical protein